MKQDQDSQRLYTRRTVVFGALQVAVLAILGGRLAWLQVAQGNRYKTLSDKNRISMRLLAPSRGQVVDRFGVPLAINSQNFRVLVVPEQTDDLEKSLRALQRLISLEDSQISSVLKKAKKTPKFAALEIKDDLSWEEVAKVEVNLPDLPGLSIDVGEMRSYPFGTATAHVVGYVSAVNKSELGDDPLLALPGFRIGKTGIEKTYDIDMRGRPGRTEVEVNVVGREVRELGRNASITGDRVTLTLDAELQRFTQQRLEQERSASAVIMDVHDGAVYALASGPSFDPNQFTRGISTPMWEELLADPGKPLTNKAIAGQYPPGSTFKMVTAMAALEAGIINANKTVFCPGHYELGKDRFHCWKKGGHGWVDVVKALAESCDTFFYEISTEVGIDRIAAMARKLGLGDRYNFELAEERPGLIPDKQWKLGFFGDDWQPGETVVASIGQGYILTTPLQLAVMTSRLVNGGRSVTPWITGYVGDKGNPEKQGESLDFKEWNLNLVKRGMSNVVNHERGTAYGSRIDDESMRMGGKTGTAQVKRITMQQRLDGVKNEDLPWKFRHHALFVGYAPLHKPQYACCVVVEHGVGGSSAAAPLARDLLLQAQQRNPAGTPIRREEKKDS